MATGVDYYDLSVETTEEILYAKMWSEDHLVKSQREEVEAALQIERNKEMLDVSIS